MPVWSLMSVVVICFNPFRTGRGLSTVNTPKHSGLRCSFNPFGAGRVFRRTERIKPIYSPLFQSLWSRAGSFDNKLEPNEPVKYVSIPLEQGGVFRRLLFLQCRQSLMVSIPLEQGGVFRQRTSRSNHPRALSQSLQNRAGSFDIFSVIEFQLIIWSQSLQNRAGSFDDCRGGLVPCWIRLEKIASQIFPSCEK